MRPQLSLLPWTTRREEVMAIEVTEAQKAFVDSSVAEFLADDDDHPTFTSYAVCDGETVVGFACYGQDVQQEQWRWWIPFVVVDRSFQGRGFGRRGMEAIIAA